MTKERACEAPECLKRGPWKKYVEHMGVRRRVCSETCACRLEAALLLQRVKA